MLRIRYHYFRAPFIPAYAASAALSTLEMSPSPTTTNTGIPISLSLRCVAAFVSATVPSATGTPGGGPLDETRTSLSTRLGCTALYGLPFLLYPVPGPQLARLK